MGGEAAQAVVEVSWWLELWREFRGEFVIGLIVALVVGYYNRKSAIAPERDRMEKDILADASARERLAATLPRSPVAAFYQRALSGALAWADRRFGPEGEPYALAWSLWLALAYSWCLFWGIWAAGGSSEVFGVDLLEASVPEAERTVLALALTLSLGLIWFAMFWIGRRIGRWERGRVLRRRRSRQAVWKGRLPLALLVGGGLMSLAFGAGGQTGFYIAAGLGLFSVISLGGGSSAASSHPACGLCGWP